MSSADRAASAIEDIESVLDDPALGPVERFRAKRAGAEMETVRRVLEGDRAPASESDETDDAVAVESS